MLALGFSQRAGRVELASDAQRTDDLNALQGHYLAALSVAEYAFDVDIDEFLLSLDALLTWPADDEDFRWDMTLLQLIEGNEADAEVVAQRLDGGDHVTGELAEEWRGVLTDKQQRDVGALLALRHGANFSVPGAGKTRAALATFAARRAAGEVERGLVVAPKSAFESWVGEARECPEPITVEEFSGTGLSSADLLLINYDRLPPMQATLIAWLRARPAFLILDEAHRVKLGASGAWGSAALAMGPFAARRLILTGTPAPNGPRDLENLFGFVWPGQGRLHVSRAVAGADFRRASSLLKPLFVRTTKGELGLPPLTIKYRPVPLSPLHRELYDALLGQESARAAGGRDVRELGRVLLYLLMAATSPALLAVGASRYEPLPYRVPPLTVPPDTDLSQLMRDLPQYEIAPKYREVLELVSSNAAAGRKTLVWSTFVRNLTSLELLLRRFGPAVVHGGTEDREEQLARFRGDDDCMVLLSNPATLGEGVSLHHACHDAIYVDRDFAAGRFLQSVDRIHRLGLPPETETRVTVLGSEGTIDDLVARRLDEKLRFIGSVLDDPAVLELGDLEEEPSVFVGMDSNDLTALVGYLSDSAA